MNVHEMACWVRKHNELMNRVKCLNYVAGDVCVVRSRGREYELRLLGQVLAKWRMYDVASVDVAYERVDAAETVVWMLNRDGYLVTV